LEMKNNNQSGKRRSIAAKISISYSLLLVFLFTVAGFSIYSRFQQIMELQIKEKGEAVAGAVTALAVDRLQAGDYLLLNKLFQELKKNEDVAEVGMVSPGGKIIAHSDPLLAGKYIPAGYFSVGIFQGDAHPGPVFRTPVKTASGDLLAYFYIEMNQGRTQKYLREFLLTMTLILLAALYAGIMLAHVLSKRIFRQPIEDLIEATRHIATGNFAHQAPVRKRDELGSLAQAFNNMTGHLSNFFRLVYTSTTEMARISQFILARTEGDPLAAGVENQKQAAGLTEISNAARRLARVVDRLNGLSLQFKINS